LALWAGDNECDYAYAHWSGLPRNPNENPVTRKLIPAILAMHDHTRPYLPSSPYMDETAYREGTEYISEFHLWGPRYYFKSSFYKESLAHFASEIGYHGCPDPESLRKFISEDALWPWQDNEEWLVHASSPELPTGAYTYRIELIAKQIRELFGTIPDNLEDFALASQISQAEAFKYFIELFRTTKWRRTGILWWNLVDGWPQMSDAVVDYYFTKKLAYDFIKRVQQPVCLMFGDPSDWFLPLYVSNNTLSDVSVEYSVTDLSSGKVMVESACTATADSSACVWRKDYSMKDKSMYLIDWEAGDIKGKNHYLAGTPAFDLREYVDWLTKAGLYSRQH
jgi:beta-mannosidase